MKAEARRLKALQLALDAHKIHCGDPVRAIQLSISDYQALDWPDYAGIPIEPDPTLPAGRMRIDCLTTTVRAAIAEFHAALLQDGDALDEAEARLEAKLDQLTASLDDWWKVTKGDRGQEWWKNVARREPELYTRTIRGARPSIHDRMLMELAQIPETGTDDRSIDDTFRRWEGAHQDFDRDFERPSQGLDRDVADLLDDFDATVPAPRAAAPSWWLPGGPSPDDRRSIFARLRARVRAVLGLDRGRRAPINTIAETPADARDRRKG